MKFAENKLYIEAYDKCCNCGVLIYDGGRSAAVERDGKLYCGEWCVEWAAGREARRAAGAHTSKV